MDDNGVCFQNDLICCYWKIDGVKHKEENVLNSFGKYIFIRIHFALGVFS